jgi:hypothetical protein
MNNKILELFAAQAPSGRRAGLVELMAAISAGSPAPVLDPKELLARLSNSNPAVASALQQMLAQQQTVPVAGPSTVIEVEPVHEAPHAELPAADGPDDGLAKELEEFRRLNESLRAEMKLMRERNDLFAAAVGACCLCWGQDLSCRSCRGRGGPGFCIPDENLFDEYIVPAIHTLRAQKGKVRSLAPGTVQRPTEAEAQFKTAANY